jgi:CubicO group peptidase (beta-lactamase class C family)
LNKTFLTIQFLLVFYFAVAQKDYTQNTNIDSTNLSFQYVSPEKVGYTQEQLKNLDDEIELWIESEDLVGAELLLLKDNQIFFHQVYGYADLDRRDKVEANALWSVKSMAKPFTATAIHMLVEEGKLSLSDKVIKYLPNYKGHDNTTIGNLISHTTGYKQNYGIGYASLKDWVLTTTKFKPEYDLDEYHYSDIGFGLSAYIVEKVSGKTIEQFIKDRILNRLQLKNTFPGPLPSAVNNSPQITWYEWYRQVNKYIRRSDSNKYPWKFYPGSSGMYTTAMDYAKFMSMFLQNGYVGDKKILDSVSVDDMMSPQAFENGMPIYGYGWQLRQKNKESNTKIVWHAGYDGTRAFAFPEDGLIAIYMNQSRAGEHLSALPDRLFMYGFTNTPYDLYLSKPSSINSFKTAVPKQEAEDYLGFYLGTIPNSTQEFLIEVTYQNEVLNLKLNSIGSSTGLFRHLVKLDDDDFALGKIESGIIRWMVTDEIFRFKRSNENVVSVHRLLDEKETFSALKIPDSIAHEKIKAFYNRIFIDDMVKNSIETDGIDKTKSYFERIIIERPEDTVIEESLLNALGYIYLNNQEFKKAEAVFQMNIKVFPQSPNSYDSLAEAFQKQGELLKARDNYQKAVKLAKEQDDSRLKSMESRLNEVIDLINNKK